MAVNLDEIPQDQTDNFPEGVSEETYDTNIEMQAFLHGLNYADDTDVYNSAVFTRPDPESANAASIVYVVRVKVGNF